MGFRVSSKALEAARAGENGRGFAVVAEQIRKLADESMQAGKNIKDIVESIAATTRRTTDLVKNVELLKNEAGVLERSISRFVV